MESQLFASVVTILTAITGVAIIAVLVSKNADTANVITAGGNAYSKALATAVSPIAGGGSLGSLNIDTNFSGNRFGLA